MTTRAAFFGSEKVVRHRVPGWRWVGSAGHCCQHDRPDRSLAPGKLPGNCAYPQALQLGRLDDVGVEVESRSCRREETPTLPNTLPRCHSTVRALRNRRVPISGFDKPCCTSRAICASSAVSDPSLRSSVCGSSRRSQEALDELARRRQKGHLLQHLVRAAELVASLASASLTPQPFAVEQVPACQLDPQPRASSASRWIRGSTPQHRPLTREGPTRASIATRPRGRGGASVPDIHARASSSTAPSPVLEAASASSDNASVW